MQRNAGLAAAMASTSATRTAGSAGATSFGSWKRVSPYAAKTNVVFTSRWRSTLEVCALDFFVQQVRASSVVRVKKATSTLQGGIRLTIIAVCWEPGNRTCFATTTSLDCSASYRKGMVEPL